MNHVAKSVLTFLVLLSLSSCGRNNSNNTKEMAMAEPILQTKISKQTPLTEEFKTYWYNGEAEITSFELSQERYGEIRKGTAVQIFVTEDFLPQEQVKANNYSKSNTPILKLNATKNFNTGIYPYSIMESSFYPVDQRSHALKVSASIQEWCGQVYAQLNNRDEFEFMSHSYFEGEADQTLLLEKNHLENEIWNLIRINPKNLPQGNLKMIPSLEYIRLRHRPVKSFSANATLENGTYILAYPELERKLVIFFNPEFPFEIKGWEESNIVGYGGEKRVVTSKAQRINTIRSAYWSQNKNSDLHFRQKLGLD